MGPILNGYEVMDVF